MGNILLVSFTRETPPHPKLLYAARDWGTGVPNLSPQTERERITILYSLSSLRYSSSNSLMNYSDNVSYRWSVATCWNRSEPLALSHLLAFWLLSRLVCYRLSATVAQDVVVYSLLASRIVPLIRRYYLLDFPCLYSNSSLIVLGLIIHIFPRSHYTGWAV